MAGKYWREAATLLLVSPKNLSSSSFNILMMKRSAKSKFMPNACVFPGGVVDAADCNPGWNNYLLKFKPTLPTWTAKQPPPMIYKKQGDKNSLDSKIAFRINAIRETFEETGILLTVDPLDQKQLDPEWRDRVHKNPSEFISLCKHLNVCPDIWSLNEWTDWLTPLHLKTKSRFDTIFYIACVDSTIDQSTASEDGDKEVSQIQFLEPVEALKMHSEEKIWLAPPQFYELSRLAAFESYQDLKNFSQERAENFSVEVWFPVQYLLKDGAAAIYPGDDFYPVNPDYEGVTGPKAIDKKDLTLEQFSAMSKRRNRMEMQGLHQNNLNCNIQDACGHRVPAVLSS